MTYPVGRNEAQRLKALRDLRILGTEPDPLIDRAAALARDLFDARIAVVSLIDEHEQWFKARCGIAAEGTPREHAFCNWTILADDVLVVEDATTCPWLKDNPLVTGEPRIRFYAGAPLSLVQGLRIGTLCVIDDKPRSLDEASRRRLADLAALVDGQLRLHERNVANAEQAKALARQEAFLARTERLAEVGGWELDLVTDEVRWSQNMFRLYDLPESEGVPSVEQVRAMFNVEDQVRIRQAWADVIEGVRATYELELALATRAGRRKWIRTQGYVERDASGRPAKLLGVDQDITARKSVEADLRASEERLRLAAAAASLGVWDIDPKSGRRDWSDGLRKILGVDGKLAPSREAFLSCLHPEDRAALEDEPYPAMPSGGSDQRAVLRIRRFDDGDERWVELMGKALLGDDGKPQRLIGTIQDVTARKQAEQALRSSEERLRLALQAGRMFAWERDLSTGYVTRSANALDLIGLGSGPASDFVAHVHPDDRARAPAVIRGEWGIDAERSELRFVRSDGRVLWLAARSAVHREPGKPDRLIGVTFDISDRKAAEERVWRAANHDPLTGLPNRALFQRHLDEALVRAEADQTSVSLLLIDLDGFKDVNDTLGHDAGDALLKATAERLGEFVRDCDTLARLGGDEFAVILVSPFDLQHATTLGEHMISRLCEPLAYEGRLVSSRASIGVAAFPHHHREARELLKDADLALYRAKAQGRNRVVAYAPEMREATERRVTIAREVHDAVRAGRIVPFYQPKVSLATGGIVGLEMLARWRHPERGVLTPGYFGSAFEDPELAIAIGESLIAQAATDVRHWLDRGLDCGRVAVNLSSAEFADPGLAANVLRLLREAGVPAQRFEVEVTETVLLGRGMEDVASILRQFHDGGVKVALDDFGTGFASLTHLKQFPVDHIKVDQSFVRDLENDHDDAAIVSAVIGLGRSLGMEVTAEGVETKGQADRLRQMGCDHAQGYLYAKPMAGSRVPWWLDRWSGSLPAQRGSHVGRAS